MNSFSKNSFNNVEITPFKYHLCSMLHDSLTQTTLNYKILDILFLIMYDFKCELSSSILESRLNKVIKFLNLQNKEENSKEIENYESEM